MFLVYGEDPTGAPKTPANRPVGMRNSSIGRGPRVPICPQVLSPWDSLCQGSAHLTQAQGHPSYPPVCWLCADQESSPGQPVPTPGAWGRAGCPSTQERTGRSSHSVVREGSGGQPSLGDSGCRARQGHVGLRAWRHACLVPGCPAEAGHATEAWRPRLRPLPRGSTGQGRGAGCQGARMTAQPPSVTWPGPLQHSHTPGHDPPGSPGMRAQSAKEPPAVRSFLPGHQAPPRTQCTCSGVVLRAVL